MNEHESMGDRGADRAADLDSTGLDPDIMEVENEKYGPRVVLVLPLSSGRYAVLHSDRRLHSIVATWEDTVAATAEAREDFARQRRTWVETTLATLKGDDLLKELGL